jgi:glycosyltransferase involved in cell wall biosynthesis
LYEELSLFVETHGLADRVRFADRRADVADILSAIDVFAMPSHSEGNANALNEAFGGGLPCVSTSVGNAPKLIRDGVSGVLVPRNDPVAMANALLTVVHDPVLRARLAKGAQESAVGPSDEEYLDRLFGIYLSLLEGFGQRRLR